MKKIKDTIVSITLITVGLTFAFLCGIGAYETLSKLTVLLQ